MHALVAQGGRALLRVHHGGRVHRRPAQPRVRPREEMHAAACDCVSGRMAARASKATFVAEGLRTRPRYFVHETAGG